jgi:hypothetical protein
VNTFTTQEESMKLFATVTALACSVAVLAGCSIAGTSGGSGSSGGGSSTGGSSTSAPEVRPTPIGPKPNFQPAVDPTSAKANQRLFVIVMEQGLVAEGISASPRSTAERLQAAGFDIGGIEWTDGSTAIGLLSDTVFVSAQVAGECIVGQYGVSIQTISVAILPILPAGGCLVGTGINRF